jgi:hypothetical protein
LFAIFAIAAAFAVGLSIQLKFRKSITALVLSFLVVPSFVVVSEYLLPYLGGGASFFPIAIVFGTIYGAIAGSLGVLAAVMIIYFKS